MRHLSGVSLVSPFTAFADPDEAQRQVALFKAVSYFMSGAGHPGYKRPAPAYFYQHWTEDKLAPQNMPMKSHLALVEETNMIADMLTDHLPSREYFESLARKPILMHLAGEDRLGSNKSTKALLKSIPMQDKNLVEYSESDETMLNDGIWMPLICNDIISWLDTHI